MPDELVARLRTLADRCNFPSDKEKERNVQYRLVRTLNDRELVKLLALPIKEMTAKMLDVCRTHLMINGEMEAMGLRSSKPVHAICRTQQKRGQQQKTTKPQQQQQQHSCGNCLFQHAPGRASCPAKDAKCLHVVRQDIIGANADRQRRSSRPLDHVHPSTTEDPDPGRGRSTMLGPTMTHIMTK